MEYKELIGTLIDLAHSVSFEETTTDKGLHKFEQINSPYFGICELVASDDESCSTWAVYTGGYKTPITKIISIGTKSDGIFEKALNIFRLQEMEYSLYSKRHR